MSWFRAWGVLPVAVVVFGCGGSVLPDLLIVGGRVYDGSGAEAVTADVAVTGAVISFVGNAAEAGIQARDTVDATGLAVTPGFIDMHSHGEFDEDYGRDGKPFLFQGITSAVVGVDGGGVPETAERLAGWAAHGLGVNAMHFVGHGEVRRRVLGMDDRAPTAEEMDAMKALVRQAMDEGAFGLSSGLFYLPGNYAETEEVIDLDRVAAEYAGAIYDTHDRDLGASYPSFGYLESIREGIRVGEEGGTKVIFSHFNAQGAHNYGRAPEGAALIEEARARGVDVQAAQHVYTATQSNLRSYTIPGWAVAGGDTAMVRRFDHPDTLRMIDGQTREMLAIRGGADHILFADPRPELNGKTLAGVAEEWGIAAPEAARRILREGNAAVMNLGLYDPVNTRYLATKEWMMTCTDGRTPGPGQNVTHPRVYGAFTKKLKDLVIDEPVIDMAFAVRSMTGLAADFLELPDRGYVREGMKADLAVFDLASIQDKATYENPHQVSEGTVHVLVNGAFAIRDGAMTGAMAGLPLVRGGGVFTPW
ncbi:MAG: amidohydrolase family protein [Gemmatimonadota bacterium]|nr:amidohydrolase family protein [Gemmatimonadota bacterium]